MTQQSTQQSTQQHIVLGAGQVGTTLASLLARSGHEVRVIRRSNKPLAGAPEIPVTAGDTRDTAWLTNELRSAAVVYNCTNPASYHRWDTELPPIYRSAWKAAAASSTRLVVLDNLYRYGRTTNLPFPETEAIEPCSEKGALRASLAAELHEACGRGDLVAHEGLAADFFGPGANHLSLYGEPTIQKIAAGSRALSLGDPDLPRAYSYVPDVAQGLLRLGIDGPEKSGTWHLPVSFAGSTREFIAAFAAAAGQSPRLFRAPRWFLRLLGVFSPPIGATVEMLYQWEHSYVPDDQLFASHFNQPATPFADAVTATIEASRRTR